MKINTFDLSGKFICETREIDDACDENSAWSEVPEVRVESRAVPEVLVTPGEGNRRPYLQDPKCPELLDFTNAASNFTNAASRFSYEKARRLETFFKEAKNASGADLIQEYMRAMNLDRDANAVNVIAVPDDFSSKTQEYVLLGSEGARPRTFLLWRSVAATLGAEEKLKGAKEGDRVAVVDVRRNGVGVAVLTLARNESRRLVPQRRSFRDESAFPPSGAIVDFRYEAGGESNDFYEHTFRGNREQVAVWEPKTGTFELKKFSLKAVVRGLIDVPIVKFCILIGEQANEKWCRFCSGNTRVVVEGADENFVCAGAAKYVVRKKFGGGDSVYFDAYDGLYLVVSLRDKKGERIEPKVLVPPNLRCPGGEQIDGIENKDCFIPKENDHVDFFLCEGIPSGTDKDALKRLEQRFGKMRQDVPLRLVSFVNPGQGLASVNAYADVFPHPVKMDLTQMKPAGKSLEDLNNEMRRSYPVDMPGVEARAGIWNGVRVRPGVDQYLGGSSAQGDLFCRGFMVNPNASGMEKFKRVNVFGSVPGKELPGNSPKIAKLFRRLSEDFEKSPNDDVLGMISWTYQRENPLFHDVKRYALRFVQSADNPYNLNSTRLFTACGNLFSEKGELRAFFRAFYENFVVKGTGTSDWMRALYEMLINNPGMLKYAGTDEEIERCFLKLAQYVKIGGRLIRLRALKCMLFLLCRRRYSSGFLQKGSKPFMDIMKSISGRNIDSPTEQAWRKALHDFLNGTGTIDGIPALA